MKIRGRKYQFIFWPPMYFDKTDEGLYRILIDPPRFYWKSGYHEVFQWATCFLWIEIRKYNAAFIHE